jgi:uncharacterized protein
MAVTREQIDALALRIAAKFRPQKIIQFGSQAGGSPQEESDVDLRAIMAFEGSALRRTVEILNRMDPQFAIDLLLRMPEEAQRRYEGSDPSVREALDEDITLCEAAA